MNDTCDWSRCRHLEFMRWKPYPKNCQIVSLCEAHWDALADALLLADNGHGSRMLRKAIKSLDTPTGWIRRLIKQGRLTR